MRVFSIDSASQRLLPAVLRLMNLRIWHYSLLAGHQREPRMYDTIRSDFHWALTANNVYTTVRDYRPSAEKPPNQQQAKVSSPVSTFPTIIVCGHGNTRWVSKEKSGKQLLVVITDRYSKMTKAIPTARKTFTAFAMIFVEHWISNFGILSTIPIDNGPQFTSKFFQAIYVEL